MPVPSTCQEETRVSERFYVVQALKYWHPKHFVRFWSPGSSGHDRGRGRLRNYQFASYDEARKYMESRTEDWLKDCLILCQDEMDMTIMAARAADALGLGQGEWGV